MADVEQTEENANEERVTDPKKHWIVSRSHHNARKITVNTGDLEKKKLWCKEWCHESVMRNDVQCEKAAVFVIY